MMRRGRPKLTWDDMTERWLSIELERRRSHWTRPLLKVHKAAQNLITRYEEVGLPRRSDSPLRDAHAAVENRRLKDTAFKALTDKLLAERSGFREVITFRVTKRRGKKRTRAE